MEIENKINEHCCFVNKILLRNASSFYSNPTFFLTLNHLRRRHHEATHSISKLTGQTNDKTLSVFLVSFVESSAANSGQQTHSLDLGA